MFIFMRNFLLTFHEEKNFYDNFSVSVNSWELEECNIIQDCFNRFKVAREEIFRDSRNTIFSKLKR